MEGNSLRYNILYMIAEKGIFSAIDFLCIQRGFRKAQLLSSISWRTSTLVVKFNEFQIIFLDTQLLRFSLGTIIIRVLLFLRN